MSAELGRAGLRVRRLRASTAEAESLASEYAAAANKLGANEAIVRAAEPTLDVRERAGRGGRSSHIAALVAPRLPRGVVFMAAASDGVDGSSGLAGAIVDRESWSHLDASDVAASVAAFDSASLHARAGTAIRTAPTGHNFADLHVLVRVSASRRSRPRRSKSH
jgi:hydroxypyruvate reductase